MELIVCQGRGLKVRILNQNHPNLLRFHPICYDIDNFHHIFSNIFIFIFIFILFYFILLSLKKEKKKKEKEEKKRKEKRKESPLRKSGNFG